MSATEQKLDALMAAIHAMPEQSIRSMAHHNAEWRNVAHAMLAVRWGAHAPAPDGELVEAERKLAESFNADEDFARHGDCYRINSKQLGALMRAVVLIRKREAAAHQRLVALPQESPELAALREAVEELWAHEALDLPLEAGALDGIRYMTRRDDLKAAAGCRAVSFIASLRASLPPAQGERRDASGGVTFAHYAPGSELHGGDRASCKLCALPDLSHGRDHGTNESEVVAPHWIGGHGSGGWATCSRCGVNLKMLERSAHERTCRPPPRDGAGAAKNTGHAGGSPIDPQKRAPTQVDDCTTEPRDVNRSGSPARVNEQVSARSPRAMIPSPRTEDAQAGHLDTASTESVAVGGMPKGPEQNAQAQTSGPVSLTLSDAAQCGLEPCPCCGHAAARLITDGWERVHCPMLDGGCGLTNALYSTEADAITAWNRRALSRPPRTPLTEAESAWLRWSEAHDIEPRGAELALAAELRARRASAPPSDEARVAAERLRALEECEAIADNHSDYETRADGSTGMNSAAHVLTEIQKLILAAKARSVSSTERAQSGEGHHGNG